MSDQSGRAILAALRLPILLAVVVVVLLEVGVIEPAAAVELVGLVTVIGLAVGLLARLWLRTRAVPALPVAGIGTSDLAREVQRLRLAIEDGARDRAGLAYTLGRHVRPLAQARLARGEELGPTVRSLLATERPRGDDRRGPGWELERIERLVEELEAEHDGATSAEERP